MSQLSQNVPTISKRSNLQSQNGPTILQRPNYLKMSQPAILKCPNFMMWNVAESNEIQGKLRNIARNCGK